MEGFVLLVLDVGPDKLRAMNALRLAESLVDQGAKLKLFLLDDGVFAAKSNQNPPDGLEGLNLGQKIEGLLQKRAEVIACGTCLLAKGIGEGELVVGVRPGTMADLARLTLESTKALVF
jgi:uncharacterized protein involved in oxidation of intracellular sulfur